MKSRLTLPLLVALTVAGYGLGVQGSVPGVPTGQWMAGASLVQPREGAVSVALDDGRVLIIGGRVAAGPVATVEALNADGSLTVLPSMAVGRVGHTAVRLTDGNVLVTGGTTRVATGQGMVEAVSSGAEIFFAASNTWIGTSPLTVARTGHTATALADGRVLVAGGTGEQGALDSIEVFEDGAFRAAGILSAPRSEAAAALAGKTQVLVAGGRNADGVLATADLVDVDSGAVAQLTLTAPRASASATTLLDGTVLVAGGNNGTDDLASAEIIDAVAGTSSNVGAMSQPRSGHQATLLDHNANVLIVGGTNAGALVTSAEMFASWTGQFTTTNPPAAARTGAVVNSTSTEGVAVLATGKAGNGAPLATTELYGFATLKTDKDDYAPGMFVTIIGSGWQPGEIVQMVLHETGPGAEPDLPLLATADEAGRIFNDIFAPNEGDLGRRFYLTAVGAGATAQTTFTDGNGTVTGTVRSSAPGNPVIAGATVSCISGCNGPSTATTNASGVYTFSANFPGNGPAPLQLTASKTGFNPATDSTSIPSNGATVTLNFTLSPVLANTTTALVSSATPSVFGQNVTFTATVAPVPPGSGTPIGTVTFRDGATTLGTGSLAAGQATFTTSALSVGNHTITAEYGGNSSFNASTSPGLSQAVQNADTTTALTSSANPSKFGQSVMFTATVTVNAPGTGTPAGSAEFFDGATSLGTVALNASGVATLSTSALTVAAHSITAKYLGSTNYNQSTSAVSTQTVEKAETSTALASSVNPSKFGQSVTFTATVSVSSPGSGAPSGTVTFMAGATTLGTGTLSGGVATFMTNALAVGHHDITAVYEGDSSFNGSTSNTVDQEVQKADTTTALTSSVNPSKFGQSVTFTATVSVSSPGSGTPSGTVTFKEGATTLGTGTLSGGVATFMTNALAVGHHDITAVYEGDSSFNGSTSNTVDQEVQKADTTTALTSSVNPSKFGQSATFTATVSVSSPGNGTPSGTVTFMEGAATLGTGTLNASGVATVTITTLSVGNHTIKAIYGGDGSFNGSTSTEVTQVVEKADTSTTVTSAPNPSLLNEAVTFTATVNPVAPGAGTRTGSVTFKEGATVLGTGTVNASGQATFTTSSLGAGSHTIKAFYGGDGNFNPSDGTMASAQTVNYTFDGFYAPVDKLPIVNNAKAGQAIPTKWRLTDLNGTGVSDPSSFVGLTSVPCSVSGSEPVDEMTEYAAGSSGLQYLGNGNWQYNWKTPKEFALQCRIARVTLLDGSVHEFKVHSRSRGSIGPLQAGPEQSTGWSFSSSAARCPS